MLPGSVCVVPTAESSAVAKQWLGQPPIPSRSLAWSPRSYSLPKDGRGRQARRLTAWSRASLRSCSISPCPARPQATLSSPRRTACEIGLHCPRPGQVSLQWLARDIEECSTGKNARAFLCHAMSDWVDLPVSSGLSQRATKCRRALSQVTSSAGVTPVCGPPLAADFAREGNAAMRCAAAVAVAAAVPSSSYSAGECVMGFPGKAHCAQGSPTA